MSLRKTLKRLGRKTAAIHQKINRVAAPVVAAGASYLFSPVVGAAVGAVGAYSGQYFAATAARNRGIQGLEARQKGYAERRRVATYSAIGVGAGVLGSFATGLIGGSSLGSSATQGLFGQMGSHALGLESTLFPATQSLPAGFGGVTPSAAAKAAAAFGGGVTPSQAAAASAAFGGGVSSSQAAAAAAVFSGASASAAGGGGTGMLGTLATTALGTLSKMYPLDPSKIPDSEGEHGFGGNLNWPDLSKLGGGGGTGGDEDNRGGGNMSNAGSQEGGGMGLLLLGGLLLAAAA